jgi:hypothetical protein
MLWSLSLLSLLVGLSPLALCSSTSPQGARTGPVPRQLGKHTPRLSQSGPVPRQLGKHTPRLSQSGSSTTLGASIAVKQLLHINWPVGYGPIFTSGV